jgi:hypothetical protein
MPSGEGQHCSDSPGVQSVSVKQGPVGTPVTQEFVVVMSTPIEAARQGFTYALPSQPQTARSTQATPITDEHVPVWSPVPHLPSA